MEIYSAVANRHAVRAFTDKHVPKPVLERVLAAAGRAPSGGNLQPWRSYVLVGEALMDLKARTAARIAAGDRGDEPEFEMYPKVLKPPYRQRQAAAARQRFAALGIERDDKQARQKVITANWECFGAPAALFCYIDREMGPPQWADLGMYLQTVMLLLSRTAATALSVCPTR